MSSATSFFGGELHWMNDGLPPGPSSQAPFEIAFGEPAAAEMHVGSPRGTKRARQYSGLSNNLVWPSTEDPWLSSLQQPDAQQPSAHQIQPVSYARQDSLGLPAFADLDSSMAVPSQVAGSVERVSSLPLLPSKHISQLNTRPTDKVPPLPVRRRVGRGQQQRFDADSDSESDSGSGEGQPGASGDDGEEAGGVRGMPKKVKHQLTDRARRKKIKDGMDTLKNLVIDDPTAKPDQVTVVLASVTLVSQLKQQVTDLQADLTAMKLKETARAAEPSSLSRMTSQSVSPLSLLMPSMNASGIGVWRTSLDCKILEVNLVFEMVTGHRNKDLVGRSPCSAPLYGSLSIAPDSYLRLFSQTEQATQDVIRVQQEASAASKHIMLCSAGPGSLTRDGSDSSAWSAASSGSGSSGLFENASPPTKPADGDDDLALNGDGEPLKDYQRHSEIVIPRPNGSNAENGNWLLSYLSGLPPNHVLKLLSRCQTAWGEVLESLASLTLIRDSSGAPAYFLSLTTPDARRIIKPPSAKFLSSEP